MKPTRSILDPAFRYVGASHSDIRLTFERHRKAQAAAIEQRRREQEQAAADTRTIHSIQEARRQKK